MAAPFPGHPCDLRPKHSVCITPFRVRAGYGAQTAKLLIARSGTCVQAQGAAPRRPTPPWSYGAREWNALVLAHK